MNTPSWQQVFAIFEECLELPADERQDFLDRACDNEELRRMVDEMLKADEQEDSPTVDLPMVDLPLKRWRAEDSVPETIGAYRILRQVGQGGMSTVYLAVRADDAFRRHVVVKLVRRGMESEPILRRLRTERQILASLDHPYISRLYDGGSTREGLPYFVMEYVEGSSIDEHCEHNELSVDERLTLFRKVCAAVHYAHENLVIHRDIKPSNILVTADSEPKLLDFGIARLLNPDLISTEFEPTATWQRIMTPSYASPEQMRGHQVTTRSDVYSLGVLLYKLLAGRLPRSFKGRSQSEIERLLAETEPVRPSEASQQETAAEADPETTRSARHPDSGRALYKQLTGDLDAIVLKALRTAPPRRYGSVEQLDADIDRYQRGLPVAARAGSWRYRAGKFVRRHLSAVAAVAAVVVLLFGFSVAMIARSAQVVHERDVARLERDKKQEVLELILDVFRFSNPYVRPGDELTVREALARSVPVLETGLSDQPEVRAELLHTTGSILNILGSYRPAEVQLQEALDIRRDLYSDAHGDVISTMSALAAARKELGELDDAEALAVRAVEQARGLGEEFKPILLAALTELVAIRCHRGQHAAAASPARDALTLARSLPAGEYEILALENLAQIDIAKGDHASAETLFRQSLALQHKLYGEDHPEQINTLSNLGLVLRRQEEFEAAEASYQDLIHLQRASFGEDYKDPFTLANLAGLKFGRGDNAAAIALYREALAAVHESSGPDHWMAFVFALAIEDARIQGGDPEQAEGQLRSLLTLWRPRLGEDNWRIAQAESVLGESVSLQGRCQEAEPLVTEGYAVVREHARGERRKRDAFERLRRHFERCGQPQKIARYESMDTPEGSAPQ